eukprot:scaffold273_cov242-Pinguiococcus_pyrenoidosus.AAC.29
MQPKTKATPALTLPSASGRRNGQTATSASSMSAEPAAASAACGLRSAAKSICRTLAASWRRSEATTALPPPFRSPAAEQRGNVIELAYQSSDLRPRYAPVGVEDVERRDGLRHHVGKDGPVALAVFRHFCQDHSTNSIACSDRLAFRGSAAVRLGHGPRFQRCPAGTNAPQPHCESAPGSPHRVLQLLAELLDGRVLGHGLVPPCAEAIREAGRADDQCASTCYCLEYIRALGIFGKVHEVAQNLFQSREQFSDDDGIAPEGVGSHNNGL